MTHETIVFTKALIVLRRKVLMIRRSNYVGGGRGEWDIPGGGLNYGEDPLDCINREVKEETGLTFRVDRLLLATTIIASPTRQSVGLTYLGYVDSDKVVLSREHSEFLWATMNQFKERHYKPISDEYTKHMIFDMLNID